MRTFVNLLAASFLVFLSACDKIEGPYGTAGNNNNNPSDSVLRKVLVEDFTGHTCQACPRAHREATRLKGVFGEQMVVIAVHADFWAEPFPSGAPYFTYDFRTPLATQIAADFGVIGQPFPKGMINRQLNPITGTPFVLDWGNWEGKINDLLQQPAEAGLKITPTYDSVSRTVTANVEVTMLSAITDAMELAVYFTEDSIIKWQKDQDASPANVQNYVHNHVLRGSLNGTYGESLGVLAEGQTVTKTYSAPLTPIDAVPGKINLVAILSNSATKEVIQAEEVHLLK